MERTAFGDARRKRTRACIFAALLSAIRISLIRAEFSVQDRAPSAIPATSNQTCNRTLCVIAHGYEKRPNQSTVRAFERYLDKHHEVVGLVVLHANHGVRQTSVRVLNAGNVAGAAIVRALETAEPTSLTARLNTIYATVLKQIRPCSIWEMDVNALILKDDLVLSIQGLLKPVSHPSGSSEMQQWFGVRPRSFSLTHSQPRNSHVVNAYPLFSPSGYYAPRGFPPDNEDDDRRGRSTPELVRVELASEDDVAVVQSAVDGVPDASPRFLPPSDEPILHRPYLPAIIVPADTIHPYNRHATLHRYDGLWAMFAPSSWPDSASDIFRSFAAQAVFPLVGKHLSVVQPLVSRTVRPPNERTWSVYHECSLLTDAWSRQAREACRTLVSEKPRCRDAGSLLKDLYEYLAGKGVLTQTDVDDAHQWLEQLRSSGYRFPPYRPSTPSIVRSPPRPYVFNAHAAVQLNHAERYVGVLPLWHAMHAAEYRQVTYHISRRPHLKSPLPTTGIYPHITFALDDRPGEPSGHLHYQGAIQAWSVHDPTTEALFFTQDDAFADTSFLLRWLNSSSCVAMSEWSKLPGNTSTWNASPWVWAQDRASQLAINHFVDLVNLRKGRLRCGVPFKTFVYGAAEFIPVRTNCNGIKSDNLFNLLQAAEDANVWLEFAWPICVRCAFQQDLNLGYKLYTRWDHLRNNVSEIWTRYGEYAHDVYHPVKLTGGLMARLLIRDDSWARATF